MVAAKELPQNPDFKEWSIFSTFYLGSDHFVSLKFPGSFKTG